MKHRKFSMVVLGAAVFMTACASGGSLSSFRGAPFPVMLGPKRVGGAPPVTGKVDDWYAEAVNFVGTMDSGNYRITTTNTAPSSYMASSSTKYVLNNVQGGTDVDLQVTSLKGTAYVTAFGGAAKEIMYVEADIVRPAGAPVAAAASAGGGK